MTQQLQELASNYCHRFGRLIVALSAAMTIIAQGSLSQDRQGWSASLETNAIDLVEVQPSGGITVFVLKNVSGKAITAFAVTHDAITHTIDFFHTDGELKPGKGLTLSVKHLPELSAALAKALEAAKSHGLIPEGCS